MPMLRSSYLQVAESLGSVGCQEFFDEILGGRVDMWGEVDPSCKNLFVDAKGVVVKEGWVSSKHLKDQNTECPPIDGFAVSFRLDDLWCKVFWCSA